MSKRIRVLSLHLLPQPANGQVAFNVPEEPLSGVGTKVIAEPAALGRSKRNWGGQIVWGAKRVVLPTSLAELQRLVHNCETNIRVVGRGHSFSPLCEVTDGTLLNLVRFSRILDYVQPSLSNNFIGTVRFEAGATFTHICDFLSEQSPPTALRQIPSPLFVTVAGALATGTHGSGINTKAISAHVQDIEFVKSDGELAYYERRESTTTKATAENVAGGHCGALGVVSRMSLDVVPYFEGHNFFLWMPLERLLTHWDELTGDLHLGGTRRPLVDSHSILVSWRKGICVINAKHFFPHYSPAVSAMPPNWGAGPFRSSQWRLVTVREETLTSTLLGAGVRTNGENVVMEITPHSLAAEAGVEVGWVLTAVGGKNIKSSSAPGQRTSTAAAAENAFASNIGRVGAGHFHTEPAEGDTSMRGAVVKIPLLFEDPTAEHEVVHGLFPGMSTINHAYRGPWHDTVPAWALGQPLEDGPDCDCGQQSEFFLPMENAVSALRAAWDVMKHWSTAAKPNLDKGCFVLSELRSIKGCGGWVSCTPRDTMSIHLSWSPAPIVQNEIWTEIIKLEKALAPLGARPHWGKIYTASFWAPRFPDIYRESNGGDLLRFKELAKQHDPEGKFRNSWVQQTMF